MASLSGELRANEAGCVAVDGVVVVLLEKDDILGDGSLRRNGQAYAPGASVRLAGGFADAPDAIHRLCGVEQYFNAGTTP